MSSVPIAVGDGVTLRKAHPCGGYDWTVVRTGADIGIKCDRCGRRVLLDRDEFDRRARQMRRAANTARDPGIDSAAPSSGDPI
jgi:hypothetical protein